MNKMSIAEISEKKSIEYGTATSGEVFYVIDGVLNVCADMYVFRKVLMNLRDEEAKNERIRKTFIELRDDEGTYYKYNIMSHDSIMRVINSIKDMNKKIAALGEYFAVKKAAGICK